MARMTISLPDGLKDRMDAVMEPGNWSAVASRAFEIELGEVAKRKREKDMSDVIQRLRADKLGGQDTAYKKGFTDGQYWARDVAGYGQLERLAAWAEDENWIDTFYDLSEDAWSSATRFYLEVEGKNTQDYEQNHYDEFWERAACVEEASVLTGAYVHGLAEGALNIFREVQPQL
jgi:hypothetical protein